MTTAEVDMFFDLDRFMESGSCQPSASPVVGHVSPTESLFSDFGVNDFLFEEGAVLPLFDNQPHGEERPRTHGDDLFDTLFPEVPVHTSGSAPQKEDHLLALLNEPTVISSPHQSPIGASLSPAVSPAPLAFLSEPPTPAQPPLASFAPSPPTPVQPFDAGVSLAAAQESIRTLFPQLMPTVERVRAALVDAVSKQGSPGGPQHAPIAPALTLPAFNNGALGTTPTNMQAQHIQQQLQALATMQAKQLNNGPIVRASIQTPMPPYAVGRKRKEPPPDAEALLAEINLKRQKNTEAARRSRARKMERLETLEKEVKQIAQERDDLAVKVAQLEAQRDQHHILKAKMELLEAKLKEAGLGGLL
ncbi:hypothetical protein HK104_001553 [Borealophlyctis nickersoniae]|nr:hypothetical protein HK104_001553 [Borealophlyctis nickersoniae]